MSLRHPFSLLVIVAFNYVLAAPACSYRSGILGAKVMKVELPIRGDPIRNPGEIDSEAF